ncbi:hypothetical protein HK102_000938 [Quaeritorhiza haematococci]|nr:hypothetical protein HK102_000938 [Quaeritorhiza haematococci]
MSHCSKDTMQMLRTPCNAETRKQELVNFFLPESGNRSGTFEINQCDRRHHVNDTVFGLDCDAISSEGVKIIRTFNMSGMENILRTGCDLDPSADCGSNNSFFLFNYASFGEEDSGGGLRFRLNGVLRMDTVADHATPRGFAVPLQAGQHVGRFECVPPRTSNATEQSKGPSNVTAEIQCFIVVILAFALVFPIASTFYIHNRAGAATEKPASKAPSSATLLGIAATSEPIAATIAETTTSSGWATGLIVIGMIVYGGSMAVGLVMWMKRPGGPLDDRGLYATVEPKTSPQPTVGSDSLELQRYGINVSEPQEFGFLDNEPMSPDL